ncbi:short coiled-coil protein B [Drosophila madeirensis]|uniref:Blast:Short coiled-coil protein homolog n=2 Tax=obscura subgroup TaxID=32357 RepID=A0A3B0JF14_DROGU|nr:short coiled-coil protein B [Drosophila obscura]XP_034127949.1 short coiled-coil protein B [Drosophila guanche]XP_034664714.1 short coiled-coil protein B [Drosophila subobscura]SPP80974.1 blast:Short coiled-coil protein homolog [Drosophila guanche]
MSLLNNDDSILAIDEDPQVVIQEDEPSTAPHMPSGQSMDSLRSSFTNRSSTPDSSQHSLDTLEMAQDDREEKARLITQVLELQNTLDDLSQRVDSVKEENLKLRSENQVLGQYIENLMSASSVFQSTSPSAAKKK